MSLTRHDRFFFDVHPRRLYRLLDFDAELGESMKVEEFREGNEYVIKGELPGIDPEKDVEITIVDGVMRLRAHRTERSEMKDTVAYRSEFHYGEFVREVPLPLGSSEADVKATYKDGILEVRVPIFEEVKPSVTHVPVTMS
jgi:HSP20 family protein